MNFVAVRPQFQRWPPQELIKRLLSGVKANEMLKQGHLSIVGFIIWQATRVVYVKHKAWKDWSPNSSQDASSRDAVFLPRICLCKLAAFCALFGSRTILSLNQRPISSEILNAGKAAGESPHSATRLLILHDHRNCSVQSRSKSRITLHGSTVPVAVAFHVQIQLPLEKSDLCCSRIVPVPVTGIALGRP